METQAARAEWCQTTVGTFTRALTVDGRDIEQMMMFPLRCGARVCASCNKEMRTDRQSRLVGDWRTFHTFSFPHGEIALADAWREIHRWICAFTSWLRKCYPRYGSWKLEYAWVLEPHQDWYPHLHLVCNLNVVEVELWRAAWRRITGLGVRWFRSEYVQDPDGVCAYLCKYLTKAWLPPEILAILGKRRLYACTLPAPPKPYDGWTMVGEMSTDVADDRCVLFAGEMALRGWREILGIPGVIYCWQRDAEYLDPCHQLLERDGPPWMMQHPRRL